MITQALASQMLEPPRAADEKCDSLAYGMSDVGMKSEGKVRITFSSDEGPADGVPEVKLVIFN